MLREDRTLMKTALLGTSQVFATHHDKEIVSELNTILAKYKETGYKGCSIDEMFSLLTGSAIHHYGIEGYDGVGRLHAERCREDRFRGGSRGS
ncbi:hypothetical protein FRC11_010777, partial [Ceratobasidium sp. 423]